MGSNPIWATKIHKLREGLIMFEVEIIYRASVPRSLNKFSDLRELADWLIEHAETLNGPEVHRFDLRQVDYCSKHSWEFAGGPGFRFACNDCDAKITIWLDHLDNAWRQKNADFWSKF